MPSDPRRQGRQGTCAPFCGSLASVAVVPRLSPPERSPQVSSYPASVGMPSWPCSAHGGRRIPAGRFVGRGSLPSWPWHPSYGPSPSCYRENFRGRRGIRPPLGCAPSLPAWSLGRSPGTRSAHPWTRTQPPPPRAILGQARAFTRQVPKARFRPTPTTSNRPWPPRPAAHRHRLPTPATPPDP